MLRRRALIRALALTGAAGSSLAAPMRLLAADPPTPAQANGPLSVDDPPLSVDELPRLAGELTLYLGRGEGGLYEDILAAIRKRNPELKLNVRRGPSVALANTLVAEAGVGRIRADLFWSIDSSSLGLVASAASPPEVPESLRALLLPQYRYRYWTPISGRVRTLAYNTAAVDPAAIPKSVMALPQTGFRFGWAPAYGAFQSFITAMRLLEGDAATGAWLEAMKPKSREYAGEFGVVMAAARGEVDIGFANHYYTLRLKQGQPDATVALALTEHDAGSLLNASGVVMLKPSALAEGFVRHLLTREVQGFLASQAFEIPLVAGVDAPAGLPPAAAIKPPKIDLEQLADLRPTLDLMRRAGVL